MNFPLWCFPLHSTRAEDEFFSTVRNYFLTVKSNDSLSRENLDFLIIAKLISIENHICSIDSTEMHLVHREKNIDNWIMRCPTHSCNEVRSIRTRSWFSGRHGKIVKYLEFLRLLAGKANVKLLAQECQMAENTVRKIYLDLVGRMVNWLEKEKFSEEFFFHRFPLVEIDEAYMSWRGEIMNYPFLEEPEQESGKWVLGIISRDRKNVWFYCLQDRTSEFLLDPIRDSVEPGTLIFTDYWNTYDNLNNEYFHLKINKKRDGFARTDENTKMRVHVNLCENLWKNVRQLAHDRHLNKPLDIPLLLTEFMFRYYKGSLLELIKVE